MSRTPLNKLSGMPQMGRAFAGWTKSILLTRRVMSVDGDGLVTWIDTQFTFNGVIQPLNAKEVQLKPEGQRAFQWLQIHSFSGAFNLDDNDQIVYNGGIYKIMATRDYSLDNYIEYHAIKDYQP